MNADPAMTPPVPPLRRRGSRRGLHDPRDARARRRTVVTWALFIGALMLMVNALVGENGYLATVRAEREYNALEASLTHRRLENQQLVEEARRLRQDPAALEEEAKRELGMVRPGETLVIIKKRPPAGSAPLPR